MGATYALKVLRENWTDPHWWPAVFNSEVVGRFHALTKDRDGMSVPDADWDTLCILDGCRYDLFEEVARTELGLEGDLQKVTSRGSDSPEFLQNNFRGGTFRDIVYVTANPYVQRVLDDPFFYTEHVWRDGWNEAEETVMPGTLIERARSLLDEYPNKRFILHFMQPHHPFVGESRLGNDPGFQGTIADGDNDGVQTEEVVWDQLRAGAIEEGAVWEAYRDNLRFVLGEIEPFVRELDGKSVLTSDHGNAFGEPASPFPTSVYGHDHRVRIPSLIHVPWFVPNYETRREITSDDPADTIDHSADADIDERLTALGYRS